MSLLPSLLPLLLLLLLTAVPEYAAESTAAVPTACDAQLRFFYGQLGLSSGYPTLPTLSFSSGVLFGTPLVHVSISFEAAARQYQLALNTTSAAPNISYLSVDMPWCLTDLQVSCADPVINGLTKTNCSTVVDLDLGGNSALAGRLFLYPQAGCSVVNLTFYNVQLQPTPLSAVYTYDAHGLLVPPGAPRLNVSQAQLAYQTAQCAYSDGAPADAQAQGQFVCQAPSLVCNQTRQRGVPGLQIVPLPQFQCVGAIAPPVGNSSAVQGMLWRVYSLEPVNSVSGVYYVTFCAANNYACQFQNSITGSQISLGGLAQYLLLAGTRRQHFNAGDTSSAQVLNLFYQQRVTSFAPIFPLSPLDPFHLTLPCVCGFSMDCLGGQGDVTSTASAYMFENNVLPTPVVGPAQVIALGQPSITLNSGNSFDDDNAPGALTRLWRLYSKPVATPPLADLPLTGSSAVSLTLNTSQWAVGLHVFVLYVSDGQDITFAVLNVTVIPNIVTVVLYDSYVAEFTPYTGRSPTDELNCGTPEVCLPLNGSLTHGSNPSFALSFNWTQVAGAPTPTPYLCDVTGVQNTAALLNATRSLACFVPPLIGLYEYRLCVCDTLGNCGCRNMQVWVVPLFLTPRGPPLQLPNYTEAPPRNLTPPTRPIILFPNYSAPFQSLPPASVGAPIDTNVPPVFPLYPPLSLAEKLVASVAVAACCFLLLLLLVLFVVTTPSFSHQRYARVVFPDR